MKALRAVDHGDSLNGKDFQGCWISGTTCLVALLPQVINLGWVARPKQDFHRLGLLNPTSLSTMQMISCHGVAETSCQMF